MSLIDLEELDDLLSPIEAARRIGCSSITVRQWASRGYRDQCGERTKLAPSGLDEHGRSLYKLIDVLKAARDTAVNTFGPDRFV